MPILKKLEQFRDLSGYLGAGVFDPYGKMMGGVTEVSGVNFEMAGVLFHNAFLFTDNISKETGFGPAQMMQVDTEMGIVIAKCFHQDEVHFHTILVIRHAANIAMAKHMLNKVMQSLKEEFELPAKEELPFPCV